MPFILPPEGRRKTQLRIGECHGSNGIPPDRRASARHASSSATDQAENWVYNARQVSPRVAPAAARFREMCAVSLPSTRPAGDTVSG